MPHRRAMIDMPIGLKTRGLRVCDLRARELVGAAVFLGARRNLWQFPDMAAANRHYWRHEGRGMGVSCQLWNIRDKIREVDDVITPGRQVTIGEAHPELVFWNLAGRFRLERKMTQRYGTGIGCDDLIDACGCAVAARDSTRRLGGEEVDPRGLRMEINY
jgi:predicted RNase H-like nuclease